MELMNQLGVRQFSLASHTLRREEGSGHAAITELLPRQKLAMSNEIHALRRLHPLSRSSNYHIVS